MGTSYYVSAGGGNNNHPGTQADKPLRTIQAAINKAQAGDTITVSAGTYAERLHIQKPGTADAPILIAAKEGEQPVIDGTSLNIPDDAALVVIQQSQDVTLRGFTIRNSGGRGLYVNKASRITLRGNTIAECYAGGLQAIQSDALLVEQCAIHGCARRFLAHGPSPLNAALLVKNCQDVTIRQNQVYENSAEGILVSVGSRQIVVSQNVCYDNRNGQIGVKSAIDVTIDSNLCYHTGRQPYLTLREQRGPGITKQDLARYRTDGSWHTRDVTVANNIVVGCGVGFSADQRGGQLSRFALTHNTILNSAVRAIELGRNGGGRRAFIENNLIASSNGGGMALAEGNEGIVWRHNLWSTFPGEDVYNPSSDVIESDIGLVNIDAPISAGGVTADPYKLVGASIAINRGISHHAAIAKDFWGTPRDTAPDIGANEFPNGSGDEVVDDPVLPPAGTRVNDGLVALYDFKQGQGQEVRDVSGVGSALHLRIMDASRVSWSAHGLTLNQPVLISSERPAKKIIDACRATNEITLEAWVRPANVTQDGPARIIGISNNKTQRNITLGQGMHGNRPADLYMARLRTTLTSGNGLPAVVTPAGTAGQSLTHIVYTRRANHRATLYVNGQERGVLNVDGDFSNWDAQMPLLLGDELSEDRPWLGLYNLCAVYGRALKPAEVLHNYEAGFTSDAPLTAEFSILPGDEYGIAPHVVEFDSADTISTAGVSAHFWEFGDGQTSTRAAPTNTYASPGVYTVSLTVTDVNGLTSKVTKEELITVVETPVAPLPAEYARFVLVKVANSRIKAFGIQYPDLRCALMWNEEPFHMMVYATVDDVRRIFTAGNAIELIWVDSLEEE